MENKSLAQFVQQTRDKLGLSPSGLAKRSNLELNLIEQIEAGEELFLPTTIRQNLAKGLKCSLEEIKELEKDFENKFVDVSVLESLKRRILANEQGLTCPKCRSALVTRIEKMYDLEDNLMLHPKARCSKCVFQLKD